MADLLNLYSVQVDWDHIEYWVGNRHICSTARKPVLSAPLWTPAIVMTEGWMLIAFRGWMRAFASVQELTISLTTKRLRGAHD